MKKRTIAALVGIVFLGFLIWRIILLVARDQGNASPGPARPPVAVEVDVPRYEPIQETRQLTGSVYPLYQYIVAPKISGRIIQIGKRIGDWVEQGEVIARIDAAEYQQAVLEAEANLKISQANLNESRSQFELAKQELERVQSLQQKGIASPAELEAATTNFQALQSRVELARAQIEQRQAALNSAGIRLSYAVLRATEPGFIGERFVDEGSLLAPNAPVVSVLGIDTVIVRTTVIERVYGQIRLGQTAKIEVDAFPGKRFHGRVSRLAPMLQEASRVAQLEVEVANDSLLLKPGMFSKVTVVLAEKESAQVVPSRAVVSREGAPGVFVVQTGESVARYLPVEVGINTPEKTEIVAPRIDGQVVTLGQHLLE
ncbi:MAG: efflux RND transporter periplasmic adaptor subunit, partial [Acidobacteriota bacterium]